VTTQTKNNTPDDASVDTTIISNLSHQENTNMLGLSVVTGLSITKKRMEEIDKQRDEFTRKQQRMDDSISIVTSSVSKLMADMLVVRIYRSQSWEVRETMSLGYPKLMVI
jgi:hypothetical protein